jgi:hypothetical protein
VADNGTPETRGMRSDSSSCFEYETAGACVLETLVRHLLDTTLLKEVDRSQITRIRELKDQVDTQASIIRDLEEERDDLRREVKALKAVNRSIKMRSVGTGEAKKRSISMSTDNGIAITLSFGEA